jgi:hypothetical protein
MEAVLKLIEDHIDAKVAHAIARLHGQESGVWQEIQNRVNETRAALLGHVAVAKASE